MLLKKTHLLSGGSGKLDNLVIKQYGDRTVLSVSPNMSRRKLSVKQQEQNSRMKMAVLGAKGMISDPQRKQRAAEKLGVPLNKVYQALVTKFLITEDFGDLFEESAQERKDLETVRLFKETINAAIPGAEIMLFGERAKGTADKKSDWELLILTADEHPPALSWEMQANLFRIVMTDGIQVKMLLVQKDKWLNAQEYKALRERIGEGVREFNSFKV